MSAEFDKSEVVVREVEVRPIRPDERRRWDALMDEHHYLGFRQFAGRGLRHVAEWRGHWRCWAGRRERSSARRATAGWAGTGRCSSGACT